MTTFRKEPTQRPRRTRGTPGKAAPTGRSPERRGGILDLRRALSTRLATSSHSDPQGVEEGGRSRRLRPDLEPDAEPEEREPLEASEVLERPRHGGRVGPGVPAGEGARPVEQDLDVAGALEHGRRDVAGAGEREEAARAGEHERPGR